MSDPNEARFNARLNRSEMRKLIGLAVAGLVFVVSAALVAAASPTASTGSSPSASGAPTASASPGASGAPDNGNKRGSGNGWRGLPFGSGGAPGVDGRGGGIGRFGGGAPGRAITISAIDGSSVSLRTDDGWSRTISITSSTKVTKAGQSISLGDLRVGDQVRFSQTRGSDGSYTIDALEVVEPQIAGTVGDVTANGFSVKTRDGTTWTVSVDGSTTYTIGALNGAKTASKSDVKTGDSVRVEGATTGSTAMTASTVHIALPTVFGQVSAKTGSTLTLTRPDGSTTTVHVGDGTSYRVPGKTNAGLSDVSVGERVVVQGSQRSDGSIDAVSVFAGGGRGSFRNPAPNGPTSSPSASSGSQG